LQTLPPPRPSIATRAGQADAGGANFKYVWLVLAQRKIPRQIRPPHQTARQALCPSTCHRPIRQLLQKNLSARAAAKSTYHGSHASPCFSVADVVSKRPQLVADPLVSPEVNGQNKPNCPNWTVYPQVRKPARRRSLWQPREASQPVRLGRCPHSLRSSGVYSTNRPGHRNSRNGGDASHTSDDDAGKLPQWCSSWRGST
jgi:hypothetical protein